MATRSRDDRRDQDHHQQQQRGKDKQTIAMLLKRVAVLEGTVAEYQGALRRAQGQRIEAEMHSAALSAAATKSTSSARTHLGQEEHIERDLDDDAYGVEEKKQQDKLLVLGNAMEQLRAQRDDALKVAGFYRTQLQQAKDDVESLHGMYRKRISLATLGVPLEEVATALATTTSGPISTTSAHSVEHSSSVSSLPLQVVRLQAQAAQAEVRSSFATLEARRFRQAIVGGCAAPAASSSSSSSCDGDVEDVPSSGSVVDCGRTGTGGAFGLQRQHLLLMEMFYRQRIEQEALEYLLIRGGGGVGGTSVETHRRRAPVSPCGGDDHDDDVIVSIEEVVPVDGATQKCGTQLMINHGHPTCAGSGEIGGTVEDVASLFRTMLPLRASYSAATSPLPSGRLGDLSSIDTTFFAASRELLGPFLSYGRHNSGDNTTTSSTTSHANKDNAGNRDWLKGRLIQKSNEEDEFVGSSLILAGHSTNANAATATSSVPSLPQVAQLLQHSVRALRSFDEKQDRRLAEVRELLATITAPAPASRSVSTDAEVELPLHPVGQHRVATPTMADAAVGVDLGGVGPLVAENSELRNRVSSLEKEMFEIGLHMHEEMSRREEQLFHQHQHQSNSRGRNQRSSSRGGGGCGEGEGRPVFTTSSKTPSRRRYEREPEDESTRSGRAGRATASMCRPASSSRTTTPTRATRHRENAACSVSPASFPFGAFDDFEASHLNRMKSGDEEQSGLNKPTTPMAAASSLRDGRGREGARGGGRGGSFSPSRGRVMYAAEDGILGDTTVAPKTSSSPSRRKKKTIHASPTRNHHQMTAPNSSSGSGGNGSCGSRKMNVDEVHRTATELKELERIAKLTNDPSTRARMLRRMESGHEEVLANIHRHTTR